MQTETIRKQTARRFVLGRQGLWPGRRWTGKDGTADALHQGEMVQVDPIHVVARSHDIALWSRVNDYHPAHLDTVLYKERRFFDYGSILMLYPSPELPYWQTVMQRWHTHNHEEPYWHSRMNFPEVREHVLNALRERGPLAGRDFTGRERIPGGFRTVKDTGEMLYYLWRSGVLMTHSRRNFDRVYDFFENVAGRPFGSDAKPEAETERFFTLKAMRDLGLATSSEWSRRAAVMLSRRCRPKEAKHRLETLADGGELAKVRIEGHTDVYYLPQRDLPLLSQLEAGQIPDVWRPLGPTTLTEAVFLAPLDSVIWDRTRAQALFDFEYLWEVYKPEGQRRWGYYTLPLLYGDRLAGRLALRFERKTGILRLEGLWLEEGHLAEDSDFAAALAAGLRHFARFVGASHFDLEAAPFPTLRASLQRILS